MAWLLIIFLSVLLLSFAVFKVGDLMSPWMLTVVVWLGILLMFQVDGDNLEPLTMQFYYCVGIWSVVLILTSLVTYFVLPSSKISNNKITQPLKINMNIFNVLFVVSMIFTPVYLYQILKIVLMFGTEDLLSQIRTLAMGEGGESGGILRYIAALNQCLLIVATWNLNEIGKWKFSAILIANLLCMFAVMEKGILFYVLIILMFIFYAKGKLKLRTILIGAMTVFLVFFIITIARFDQTNKDSLDLLDFFYAYILSPSVAFCHTVEKLTLQMGSRTFAFFYAFLTKTGLGDFVVEKKVQEYVFVPIFTNVYTVFQPFFQDFGYRGVAFFASVYGVFSGVVYRYCRNGRDLSRCLYPYLVEVLVLQFYQENLIIGLSVLIQYLFIFVLLLQHWVYYKNE